MTFQTVPGHRNGLKDFFLVNVLGARQAVVLASEI